ncbi:hypothetical protein TUM15745_04660 [Neisseria gonorrhoeae]|nr:hypothetical protein TUM15745_04660 [Neisseria gonorrhoeae]GFL00487.1 hypothetical protein TUM15746_02700 [Neisseria gonorrhoeae]GFL12753.1 hypothetical protein TUM15752_01640 [Neisseria gonorrhoeae]GFL27057.1 hypothetical protein TUM15759_02760 [Neisseria gonorrhoeae]GFL37398.1 hypothetical protein TUM15764_04020 [Neisseria gonorrhoeae]
MQIYPTKTYVYVLHSISKQQYRKQTFQKFGLTDTILANHRINTLIGLEIYLHRADTGYMLKTNRTVKQPFIHIIRPSIFQTA